MYISHLALDDFRSYKHAVVEFAPGTTVLLGRNGQGKTNLVEAIAYLANLSSHRVAADTALVRFAKSDEQSPAGAVVRAKVITGGRDRVVELEIIRGRANRAKLNRAPVRPTELMGVVKVVVFAPEDLDLVKGDPSGRRKFIDEIATQMWPAARVVKNDFDRVAKQRAALLKQLGKDRRAGRHVDYSGIEIWNEQYIPLARQVLAYRLKTIQALHQPVTLAHDIVSEEARKLTLRYEHSLNEVDQVDTRDLFSQVLEEPGAYEERLRLALSQAIDQEIARGVNLIGPHRDELGMTLDEMPVKGFASHGESWSVALALRLGAFEALAGEAETGEELDPPILILDDVFSELDGKRREAVLGAIERAQQVFITAAVGTDLPAELDATVMTVHLDRQEGSIVEESLATDIYEKSTTPIDDAHSAGSHGANAL